MIGPPWLAPSSAHHHEAVLCVERICGVSDHDIDYKYIPGCTYTHPQVASMGMTEKKAREDSEREHHDRQIPLQRQRPRPGGGRDRWLCQAHLRRQIRRAARRSHDRRKRHRAARPNWSWPESSKRPRTKSSKRCTRIRRCPKPSWKRRASRSGGRFICDLYSDHAGFGGTESLRDGRV